MVVYAKKLHQNALPGATTDDIQFREVIMWDVKSCLQHA